jgi:hypothetical protein
MSKLRKEIIGDELYLFNEKKELIFKRWLKWGYSKVFDVMTYGKNDTYVSVTDNGLKYKDKQVINSRSDIK